jgi:hypothetical protein
MADKANKPVNDWLRRQAGRMPTLTVTDTARPHVPGNAGAGTGAADPIRESTDAAMTRLIRQKTGRA